MKKIMLILLIIFYPGLVSAQKFVVDERLEIGECDSYAGWEETGMFESGNVVIKHCVRREAYNSEMEFVVNSYFNVLDSGEDRCPLGGSDSGVFSDDNGNSVYLCVEREKERTEEFRSEVKIEESCEEGFEQEGDMISITDGEIVHCSKKTEEDKSDSPLKDRRETVARMTGEQREERSCSGLSKQECSSKQGCSVKNLGQSIPNCGFICEIIRFFLSGFYTGCEGSFDEDSDENAEEEFCVECEDKTWSDCIAHVNCKRSSEGGCEASACSGRYNYEGGSFKVPKCRNNNNPDDDGEIEIEYENGIINSEIVSSDKSGKCTSYRIKLPPHTCQRCEQDDGEEEQEAEGGPVYTSPCISEFEDEYASVVMDACGNVAKNYVGSAEYLMSDDECEEANENNNDLAETPRECSELIDSNEREERESGSGEEEDGENGNINQQCVNIINQINKNNDFEKELYEGKKFVWRILGKKSFLIGYAKALVSFESVFFVDKNGEKYVKVSIHPDDSRVIGLETVIKAGGESYAKKLWPDNDEIRKGKSICINRKNYKKTGLFGSISYERNRFIKEMSEYFDNSFKNNGGIINGRVILLINKKEVKVVDGNGKNKDAIIEIVCGERVFDANAADTEKDGKRIVYLEYDGFVEDLTVDSNLDIVEDRNLGKKFDELINEINKIIKEIRNCLEDARNHCVESENNSNILDCSKIIP